jgi:hypothetical protein
VPAHTETNVRLPHGAFDALAAVTIRRGTSRDETVRQLLAEYVEVQEALDPDDRLTHISTVLRYPSPPRHRSEARTDRSLRLRAQAALLDRARAVSLRLPGQYQRAYRDYQARTLTDAVMTAIALVEPFTDDFLNGLRPLLRHRAALGLWRLNAIMTATKPEKNLLIGAELIRIRMRGPARAHTDNDRAVADQHLLRVADVLEEETAWHAPARFHAAADLARTMLTGPRADTNERLLYDQDQEWRDQYLRALRDDDPPVLLWDQGRYDWTGRGGTAVWRAYRKVELQEFEDWLVGREEGAPAERVVTPPGWLVRTPAAWHAHAPAMAGGRLPEPYATWAAEGKALTFPYKSRQALWPLLRGRGRPGGEGFTPVPGIGPLMAAAAGLRPEKVITFIEAVLIEWNHEFGCEEEPLIRIALDIPADKAHAFGFITFEKYHETMARARTATLERMDAVIDTFKDDGYADAVLRQLAEARRNTQEFRRLVRRYDRHIGSKFTKARATWPWAGQSVAGELLGGAPAELVEYLATAAHKQNGLLLEYSMQEAWQRAFDRYGFRM